MTSGKIFMPGPLQRISQDLHARTQQENLRRSSCKDLLLLEGILQDLDTRTSHDLRGADSVPDCSAEMHMDMAQSQVNAMI